MNKNLEGFIRDNQFFHLGNRENKQLFDSICFFKMDWRKQTKEEKLTTGLIIFSLLLLFLFF